jgi:hypothetical protein
VSQSLILATWEGEIGKIISDKTRQKFIRSHVNKWLDVEVWIKPSYIRSINRRNMFQPALA